FILKNMGDVKEIGQYKAMKYSTLIRKRSGSAPLVYDGWAAHPIMLPHNLLTLFYRALSVRHRNLSTDLPYVYAEFQKDSLLPIYTTLYEPRAKETDQRYISRINRIEKVPYQDSLFVVPEEDYSRKEIHLPTEEEL